MWNAIIGYTFYIVLRIEKFYYIFFDITKYILIKSNYFQHNFITNINIIIYYIANKIIRWDY